MWRWLPLLPLLVGCAGTPSGSSVVNLGCGGEVRLRNLGDVTVEQAYFSAAGPADWGRDVLAPGTLPPGGEQAVAAPPGRNAVRIVFANGRAAGMDAMDVCATPVLSIRPGSLLAER